MAATAPAGADPVPYDPAAGAFSAQAARPATLAAVGFTALDPYHRSLLVIDGTVTRFMEAWWLEPVAVRCITQHEVRLAAADAWLELDAGAPVLERRVVLTGERSGRFCAWADSRLAAARLPPAVRRGLERDAGGLGRVLIDTSAETRREGLWFGREHRDDVPAEAGVGRAGEFLTRSYRLIAGGRSLMLITERFPL